MHYTYVLVSDRDGLLRFAVISWNGTEGPPACALHGLDSIIAPRAMQPAAPVDSAPRRALR